METTPINPSESKDPFLLRAIEYWLDSANELGYQPLFCEWLITQDYALKYSIKNTNFEQGKDVIAVSREGIPYGYQLKGGNINLNRWRTEVKPEIEALIDCAIQHPDIDKDKPHVSYLVTNGEIDDSVRIEILALNEKKWKETPLHYWTRGDLLNGFQQMASGVLPKDARMYKKITDLIFADGTGFPDASKIFSFLREILDVENTSLKKEQRRRDIAAAVLYATMIAGPYRKEKNHASVVRIMVLLLSLIFFLVDKYCLEDKYWIESYEIIWKDILTTSKLLEFEINIGGFDKAFTTPFDTDLIPFRKHAAVSMVYPLKLVECMAGDESWKTVIAPDVAEKYKGAISLWGEASLIPFIILTLTLKNIKETKDSRSNLIRTAIQQILNFNSRKSKHPVGLIPPYYDLDFAVKLSFGMLEDKFEDKYKLGSYLIKPLIEIMVRLGERKFISDNWREISFMHFEEFRPTEPVDYYLYRVEKGENLSIVPKKEKSWSELVSEAGKFDGKGLPPTMKRFPNFLAFFLAVFPFRANSETLGFLYDASNR